MTNAPIVPPGDLDSNIAEMHERLLVLQNEFGRRWSAIEAGRTKSELAAYCVLLLNRVHAWVDTLARLDRYQDFQAHAVAARFTLEATVDFVLFIDEPTLLAKYGIWEDSARLAAGPRAIESGYGSPEMASWVAANKARVTDARNKTWPRKDKKGGKPKNSSHPMRWTGTDLRTDVVAAEKIRPLELTKFAALLDYLNWSTHGSGVAVAGLGLESFKGLAFGCLLASCTCAGYCLLLTEEIVIGGPPLTKQTAAELRQSLRLDVYLRRLSAIANV